MTQIVWPNGSTQEPPRSDGYGPRDSIHTSAGWTRPFHAGTDHYGIGDLRAIGDGEVVDTSWVGWAGWQVIIYLGVIDGRKTWVRYCHLASRSPLKVGARVKRGDLVGREGATGQVVGKHLHWEVYRDRIDRGEWGHAGTTIDPRTFVRAHLAQQTPAEPEEEDEDMWKPTVHVRTEGNPEYMLAHPEIGIDLKPGEKRNDGDVTVFRGYMVTSSSAIARAWARMYARGLGQETSRTNRAQYIEIQAEARRLSLELARG